MVLVVFEAHKRNNYGLILLDLLIFGKDGYGIRGGIRNKINVPVIIVTIKTESTEKMGGLVGDNDYTVKPFDSVGLTGRLRARIKRLYEDKIFR